MPSRTALLVFTAAALAFLAVPGPSVLYVVTRSLHQGRAAGVVSALGVATGSLAHTAAAAFGISAVLMASATAFTAVKLAGAAYLVVLGVKRLRRPHGGDPRWTPTPETLPRVYVEGVVVNLLNPKTALFFLAFLPQFADPAQGSVSAQVTVLGLLLALLGVLSDGTYGLLAGSAGDWLRRNPRIVRASERAAGGVYVALGVTAALARRPAPS